MKFIIITGLSGAGKSEAMRGLEDSGYYCIDNIPPALIVKFAQLCSNSNESMKKVALGVDIRGRQFFRNVYTSLDEMKKLGYEYEIVFLDCEDEVLVKRYKMTRRNHPLSFDTNILEGIVRERELLKELKIRANVVIDTSNLKPKDLRKQIRDIYIGESEGSNLVISVTSFGYKHGIPLDADLVFDVRFLPNPYYIEELKEKTGDEEEVQSYVMNSSVSWEFLGRLKDFIDFLVPNYMEEGKHHLVIAIGCTGGKHRSVTFTNMVYDHLLEGGYRAIKKHRDIRLK
ncbi:MAG: RNase adapter RapZ [Peptoclostridium sp.]|uniref:RNase adapter RapZ n=1 Tax=Peptoclostridium sp. TaxID=1904860 RepID=UPI00139DA14A|nr:RNase adapter RapZ [Peptoclostridium sp.]MZQ74648.1 RNase adapter RapZ [Peptoclostridium sp.]